jgi:hypothetical protein
MIKVVNFMKTTEIEFYPTDINMGQQVNVR